jgi:hypothetical protein
MSQEAFEVFGHEAIERCLGRLPWLVGAVSRVARVSFAVHQRWIANGVPASAGSESTGFAVRFNGRGWRMAAGGGQAGLDPKALPNGALSCIVVAASL